jgi:hypothetical protein
MNLNNENINALLGFRFALDFIKIILTQKGCDSPIIYSGPGTIAQNEDGNFHLKLYHSFVDTHKELFGETGQIGPGQLIGDKHYFSLSAVDMTGGEWVAEKVLVPRGLSFPAAGKIVTSKITKLNKVEMRKNSGEKSNVFMLVKGKFSIPANDFEDRDGHRYLNTFKMENDFFDIELKERNDHLLIRLNGQKEFFKEETADILLEALSIIFGKIVTPVYREMAHGETQVTSLISTPKNFPNVNISEPIPCKFPHKASPLKEFLEKYLSFASKPYTDLFGFWHKINRSWQGGVVNAALYITVSIEGIIKTDFKEYGYPDEDFINQINDAIESIKTLDIGKRAKERILTSINVAKSSNPRSALIKLSESGYFDKGLVEEWKSLRNMSAHADKLNDEQIQKYIDKVYNCLLLFYNLLFIIIKYESLYYDFSREGWPETIFVLPKEVKSIL